MNLSGPDARRAGVALAVLAAVVTVPSMLAAGAEPALAPLAKLRRTDAELRAAVNRRLPDWSPEAAVRQNQIDGLLRGLLDYEEIARRALGSTFTALGPDRQRAFVAAFSALTSQTFLAKMQRQLTRITYDAETIDGSEARVTATACPAKGSRGATDAHVEYHLLRKGTDWRITDVVIDGASLVASYERQFRKLVAREGIDGLMARMRDRLSTSRD